MEYRCEAKPTSHCMRWVSKPRREKVTEWVSALGSGELPSVSYAQAKKTNRKAKNRAQMEYRCEAKPGSAEGRVISCQGPSRSDGQTTCMRPPCREEGSRRSISERSRSAKLRQQFDTPGVRFLGVDVFWVKKWLFKKCVFRGQKVIKKWSKSDQKVGGMSTGGAKWCVLFCRHKQIPQKSDKKGVRKATTR
jgi:hypothetical protein